MKLMKLLRFRRSRMRFVWLGLLALLFQQLAFATYACPVAVAPHEARVSMSGCAAMEMPDPAAPALCDQHCARDHATAHDLKAPQVPALALPPVHFALTEALLPPVRAQFYHDIPLCQSDPPLSQRFCSLQI